MAPTSSATSLSPATTSMPVQTDSCCTRVRNCLSSQQTIQSAKIVLSWMGSMGSLLFVPVPFLNGALSGVMMFMAVHEVVKHPDSIFMQGACKPILLSRSWKHISAGVTISGVGWGLGALTLSTNIPIAIGCGIGLGFLGGIGLSCLVAYSDVLCLGNYARVGESPP